VLRVAIIDDHPVARHGIATILAPAPAIQVVAAVGACGDLPRDPAGQVLADVVLLDLYLDEGRLALDAVAELSARLPVLVVSASRKPSDVLAAMQAGASGYLTKNAREDAYAVAVETVGDGGFYLSAQLADLIQAATRASARGAEDPLSPREQEALSYVARGFTHRQTATRMGVSKATVDTYVARIRAKLNLGNKAELALAALRYLDRTVD
jgi:two-component system, NarL family, nitrate/nitrite response regulator NarL